MNRLARPVGLALAACAAAMAMALWIRNYGVSGHDLARLGSVLHWWTLPLLLLMLAAHVALAAVRWSKIEVALGGEPPSFNRAFTAGAVALGLGTFLPGLLTNVASRGLSNRLGGSGAVRGAISGSMDQLADLAIVLLFVPAAILGVAAQSLPLYLASACLSAVLGFAALPVVPALIRPLKRRAATRNIGQSLEALSRQEMMRSLYRLSLLRFACLTTITLLIHFATGAASIGPTVIAIPLVTVAISLAMLPGGLGVSEWSFSAVFAAMGIAQPQIVLFVLGNRILLSAGALALMTITLAYSAARIRRSRPKEGPVPVRT